MNGRPKGLVALTLLILLANSEPTEAQSIVIDPGHGGHDHGATAKVHLGGSQYQRVTEKDLALSFGKKLRDRLKKERPDIKVYLTREEDTYLSLVDRGRFAQMKGADFFISIHCNSHKWKGSRGFETFVLNNASDKAAKQIEQYENSVDGVNSDLDWILMDLVINENIQSSAKFANLIQKSVSRSTRKKGYKVRNRGVKQALLSVLYHARTPGVLVELGFLSNPKELKMLTRGSYQNALVDSMKTAITNAIPKNFKKKASNNVRSVSL